MIGENVMGGGEGIGRIGSPSSPAGAPGRYGSLEATVASAVIASVSSAGTGEARRTAAGARRAAGALAGSTTAPAAIGVLATWGTMARHLFGRRASRCRAR